MNGNMFEYLLPMAGEMPDIEVGHIETPHQSYAIGRKRLR